MKALAAKAVSELLKNSESKKSSPCLSPRTPYILAPRSVYAFTLLPLSRHSTKWRYSIFSDLRIYPQNFVFIRGNLTFIFPCAPSVNRHTVYGLLVKKSMVGRHELSSLRSSGDSIFGRYVTTEQNARRVRARRTLGRYVATELCACLVAAYRSSLACPWSDCRTRACPRPYWIHVCFLRTIGIDSVVTDFDPNKDTDSSSLMNCLSLSLRTCRLTDWKKGEDALNMKSWKE
ncbi:hypothetical protein IGI04_022688 [Brassica rapa subsp. trilocularis]|uniref:Uncharacterized protein n=1 Tax=Brassica rapa subsp. trilocularis TaxID=1813537 RepID=A0ABQ7M4A4_BRACM|nr:hypothetical protein IGI04_022688 [Brassica rapa subsp. trilocularis]